MASPVLQLRPRNTYGVRMDTVKSERIAWRSRGRVARGKLTILDGDPGLGKSTLLMDWAARVSRGEPLFDGDPQPERGVLLICGEDDPGDTIRPRLEVMGADLTEITLLTEVPTTTENGQESLRLVGLPSDVPMIEGLIRELEIGLVIIDPLMAFIDADLKANSDQDVRQALTPLATALQRTSASGLLVRHLNKSASANSLYRGGGSIGIIGVARLGLLVAKSREDKDIRILASTKSNIGPPPRSIAYRLASVPGADVAKVEWLGEVEDSADDLLNDTLINDDQRADAKEAEDFLLAYLARSKAQRSTIIADAKRAGISIRAIDAAKRRLGIKHTRLGAHLGPENAFVVWHLPGDTPTDFTPPPANAGDGVARVDGVAQNQRVHTGLRTSGSDGVAGVDR